MQTMTARTILLVDDDADLRETLVEQLGLYEEFNVLEEATAGKGVNAARNGQVDLLMAVAIVVGLVQFNGKAATAQ